MRRFIMTALSSFKPAALLQLINDDAIFPTNQCKQLVEFLLRRYCSRFVTHLTLKRSVLHIPPEHPKDTLSLMANFHNIWEAFPSDHPWADSEDQPISYFLDVNFRLRQVEANAAF